MLLCSDPLGTLGALTLLRPPKTGSDPPTCVLESVQCQQLSWKGRSYGFVLPCLKITTQLSELVLPCQVWLSY